MEAPAWSTQVRSETALLKISALVSRANSGIRIDALSAASAAPAQDDDNDKTKCVYLCGNSLGLQPRRTATRINQYLSTWATQGVQGHFKPLDNSPLPTWLDADARAADLIAPIVGASPAEVAVMQTLTANLHLLMSAFYHPDPKGRHKIILESKAFPSDHVMQPPDKFFGPSAD